MQMRNAVKLSFPNQSRSYDDVRRQVRFLGHVGMESIPFRIDADALIGSIAGETMPVETACLTAFDARRSTIERAAGRVYSDARKSVYILTARDLQ
ncbi:DUF1488 domain-containing protein [Oricola indica]|jgi:hypothetical protein|uniref:DUF1488 domain-containing protein n=1 Tax=Oricola indica TaxID=2872591 RepID=UPI001CBDD5C4|nr:DUF1488 domain-containing protein [Oricola indica]